MRKVIVLKIGSSTLLKEDGRLDKTYIASLAQEIAQLKEQGYDCIIVSSAAIASGLEVLGLSARPTDMPSLQACASVGQTLLTRVYDQAFEPYGIATSLVLLTRHETAQRVAYLHARDTFERLLDLGVVPIVNENDTVSVEEIKFGDNDTLASLVACLVKADLCVIFSDIDGLYTKDPRKHIDAALRPMVSHIDEEIMQSAQGVGSAVGSGGMKSKIASARVLMAAGIPLVICHGRRPKALTDIIQGQEVGTRFEANQFRHEISPKKLWIALGDAPSGAVVVDKGAYQALVCQGTSLLSVGVVGVEGSFDKGDVVDLKDIQGHTFARGLVQACRDEVFLSRGLKAKELMNNQLIKHLDKHPVVHRDELIVFD